MKYLGKHTAINANGLTFFTENKNMRGSLVQVQPPQPTSSTEKDIGAENPETATVSGFFHADF